MLAQYTSINIDSAQTYGVLVELRTEAGGGGGALGNFLDVSNEKVVGNDLTAYNKSYFEYVHNHSPYSFEHKKYAVRSN